MVTVSPSLESTRPPAASLLPTDTPEQLITADGTRAAHMTSLPMPDKQTLRELYRRMVIGRRFDNQAIALTKQGRLAVYPSSRGQDACEVGAMP